MSPKPIKSAQTIQKPVKNFAVGRKGYEPQAIVIHTAGGGMNETYLNYQSKATKHSSHYLIGKKGEIWHFVKETDTAWHCGGVANPTWPLIKTKVDPNLYTIGIDFEGNPNEAWTEKMYQSAGWLIQKISKQWRIPLDEVHIIAHSQINNLSHADCPGIGVDMDKLVEIANAALIQSTLPGEAKSNLESENDLRNQLSILILENTSLKQEVLKLERDLQSRRETKLKTITSKNVQLSTEVYRLQQLQIKTDRQIQQYQQESSQLRKAAETGLKGYSFPQIFNAIIAKILRK